MKPQSAAGDRPAFGMACITFSVFIFAITDAVAKWLGQEGFAAPQIVFCRYLVGLGPVAFLVWRVGPAALKTRHPLLHALRAGLIFLALVTFFAGLSRLPLAEAIAVAFTAPLFVTALSGPLLGERVGARRWLAVAAGFLGALVMLRPGTEAFRPEALFILASAMAFSLAMILTRRMAATETNVALFSYTTIGAGLASLPLALYFWQVPAAEHYGGFVFLGLLGSVAAFLVILAYRFAPAAVVAPFEYTALIWGAILGWLFWREQPQASALLGAAIIVAAGLYILYRESRSRGSDKRPNSPAK